MARKATTAARAPVRRGLDWTVGLAILATAMAAAALPLCVVLVAGLIPTAVAVMVDQQPGRYLARTVAPANLAGTVLPVLTVFRADFTVAGALHVLSDPRNWLIMYGAAAVGWVLNWAMPLLTRVALDFIASGNQQRLRKRAEQIVAEWGSDVTGPKPGQPPK